MICQGACIKHFVGKKKTLKDFSRGLVMIKDFENRHVFISQLCHKLHARGLGGFSSSMKRIK